MQKIAIKGRHGGLCCYLSTPPPRLSETAGRPPVVVVSSAFIPGQAPSASDRHVEELSERICAISGFPTYAFAPSGVGSSEGTFGVERWMADLRVILACAAGETQESPVVLLGFGFYAAVIAMVSTRSLGVVGLGSVSPAVEIYTKPGLEALIRVAAASGVKQSDAYTPSDAARELRALGAPPLGKKVEVPWLVIASSIDRPTVESTIGAGIETRQNIEFHYLLTDSESIRYDPRSLSILMGWLERKF